MGRSRILKVVALAVAVVPAVLVAPQPTHAADAGGAAFEGTASLPKFPCPIQTPCLLTSFTGTASGQMAGDQFGPWEATFTDAVVTATNVVYQDTNCVTGTASGHITVNAGPEHALGVYKPNNATGTLPLPIQGITIEADFTWQRAGATAGLVLANGLVKVTIPGQPSPMIVMSGGVGGATAAFHANINPMSPPDCDPTHIPPTNAPAITAEVAGAFTLVDRNVA